MHKDLSTGVKMHLLSHGQLSQTKKNMTIVPKSLINIVQGVFANNVAIEKKYIAHLVSE